MKRLAYLNILAVLFIVAAAPVLLPVPAQAYVYDNFNGTGINPALWVDTTDETSLFSQPGDGNLYFSDPSGGQIDSLRTYSRWNMPFFVSLQYAALLADNHGSGEFSGSSVSLWMGYTGNTVAVYEFKLQDEYGFRAVKTVNGQRTALTGLIGTTANSGWLGIDYDGAKLTFMYDTGSGWQEIATCDSFFTENPFFGVQGYNPYGDWLSFRVEQVQVVPLPAGVWLLGSGLLGLAGWRRFRKS